MFEKLQSSLIIETIPKLTVIYHLRNIYKNRGMQCLIISPGNLIEVLIARVCNPLAIQLNRSLPITVVNRASLQGLSGKRDPIKPETNTAHAQRRSAAHKCDFSTRVISIFKSTPTPRGFPSLYRDKWNLICPVPLLE